MDIVVLLKQVPDPVEELEIAPSGKAINRESTRFVVSEADAHALEEAVLLKERHGGTVTAVTLDIGEADDALYAAIARGANRAVKLTGEFPEFLESHQIARAFAKALEVIKHDLVLAGSQAIDDLDGPPGAILAGYQGLPYVSVVNQVQVEAPDRAIVSKELPGGAVMHLRIHLPAVVGVQSAEQPPRYVPVSKVRQVMRSATIEEVEVGGSFERSLTVRGIHRPEPSRHAIMLEGGPDEVAGLVLQVLREKGVLR